MLSVWRNVVVQLHDFFSLEDDNNNVSGCWSTNNKLEDAHNVQRDKINQFSIFSCCYFNDIAKIYR